MELHWKVMAHHNPSADMSFVYVGLELIEGVLTIFGQQHLATFAQENRR